MSIDPEHVEALADLVGEWLFRMHGIQSSCDHRTEATELLTSTDPAVHAALLAALVRAGVLDCEASGGPVEPEGKRRYVTDWEETCD